MRERFCKFCRGWHDLDKPWPRACWAPVVGPRSRLPGPMLIRDGMEPVQSMLDGKMYDSKAALRATYKAAGVTEVGNDSSVTKPFVKPRVKKADVMPAVHAAFSKAGLGA